VLHLPWAVRKIQENFNDTEHVISIAKDLVRKGFMLCNSHRRKGRMLPEAIMKLVMEFYKSDEVSHTMPRKKDFVIEKTKISSKCKRN
jgi:hypothetical protein